jgi:MFS family permease
MRPGLRSYLRSLNPGLPAPVWLIEVGGAVNAVGSGMILPFNLIYLHNVRGISLAAAGAALAVAAAASFASGLAAGSIVDRIGGRNTLVGGLLLQAAAVAMFPLIRNGWQAAALLGLFGMGTACFWPGQSTLLARLTPPEKRHHTYSLQRISMNLGIGIGGVGGGLIATTAHPHSFTWLYVIDAATFFGFIAVLGAIREPRAERQAHEERASYREVARDRAFVRLIVQNVIFVAAGYEVVALMPVYAKNHAGVAERWIGFVWFANTMLIVVAQMPITKWLEGRRRMVALAWMNVLWAGAALIVLAGGTTARGGRAAVIMIAAVMVFAIGECLQGATQGALTADLAPERLRGRYFALGSMSWSLGSVLGPAVGGPLLGWKPDAVWPLAAGVCLLSAVACLRIERLLPESVRRTPRGAHVEPEPAVPGEGIRAGSAG